MRIKGISWVGVKTGSYDQMARFFTEVMGLPVDFEQPDFAVFRLPDGDKLEIFGPQATDPPEQFARNGVVAGLLVEDILQGLGQGEVGEGRTAGVEVRRPLGQGLQPVLQGAHRADDRPSAPEEFGGQPAADAPRDSDDEEDASVACGHGRLPILMSDV